MRLFARASAHVVAVALVSPALAQIPIAGALSDATTGPLTSGNVYHVTSSINVPPGATLTIQPNVVVKLSGTQQFSVNGTLLVDGSGPDSIVFTDLRDDAFGGDSNGDGNASVPAPGGWGSIVLAASSSASDLRGLTVRYAGVTSAGLRLVGSSAALTDCRVDLSGTSGFEVGLSSRPTLTSCTASNCVGEAFDDPAEPTGGVEEDRSAPAPGRQEPTQDRRRRVGRHPPTSEVTGELVGSDPPQLAGVGQMESFGHRRAEPGPHHLGVGVDPGAAQR